MRSANILLISVKALGTEIAKNLILNGIGSLTIVDSEQVTEDDLGAQYYVREEDVGRNVSVLVVLNLWSLLKLSTEGGSCCRAPPGIESQSYRQNRQQQHPDQGSDLLCPLPTGHRM